MQLRGEIDLLNASELESVLGGLVRDGVERVVLDFDGVDSIDSSGLRAIVSTANGLSTGTRCVRVIRPRESIRSLFDATGLTHLFRIDHPA